MISSLKKVRETPVSDPLPPCWLRTRPTTADDDSAERHVLRIGDARRLHRALIDTIDAAREVVIVASFLLADEQLATALLRAAEGGKRVYVLTASEERLSKIVRDDDVFEAFMVEEHKRLLNRFAGKVLLRSAQHFHAKLLVIDPQSAPQGWITTANFNKALHDSVELGVRLDPEAARDVAAWFSFVFWSEAERELTGKGRLAELAPPPGVPPAPLISRVVTTTKQHRRLRDEVLRIVHGARTELFVSSYGFDSDHAVVKAVVEKARAGVPVTILTRPRPAVSAAVALLAAAGARVLAHDKLHAKAVVSDAGAVVMSANVEAHGLDDGFEIGLTLEGEAHAELQRILSGEWPTRFPWRFAAAAERTEHLGEICLADKGLREGIRRVIESQAVPLAPVTAVDALRMDEAPEPALHAPPIRDFPRRRCFEWQVHPPQLPKGAVERKRMVERRENESGGKSPAGVERVSFDPPVFDHNGAVFIVVKRERDFERARQVAQELGAKVVVQ